MNDSTILSAESQGPGNGPSRPRDIPSRDCPEGWTWIARRAHERILNELGASDAAYGIAVYMALARLWNKDQPQIEATVAKIAGMARISYPKCLSILEALESQAKVIQILRRERAKGDVKQPPHLYVLLSSRRNAVKPARLNTVKPGRLNGAGLTEQAICGSENPKESLSSKDREKEESNEGTASIEPFALDGQGSIAVPKEFNRGAS